MTMRSSFGALIVAGALALGIGYASAQNCTGQPAANQFCAGPPSGGAGFPRWRATVAADLVPVFSPVSGTAITINGPSGLSPALIINQTVAGAQTTNLQLNQININDSAAITTPGFVANGLNIAYVYGGGSSQGSRQALQVGMVLTAPTNVANTRHFYAGAQIASQANSGDNGTNTGAGALGSIIALNPAVTTVNGATNLAEASGIQVTMFTLSGSSVSQRSGIEISDNSGAGGIQGATFDDAIVMGNVLGSAGWKIGLAFDRTNFGSAPLAATGTAIATVGAQTIATFIDVTSATLTTFLKSTGFTVDGSGNTTTPLVAGGTAAASSLTLESTSGAGTTGTISLKTGSQVTRQTILGNGQIGFGTETNPQARFVFSGNTTTGILGIAGANSHTVEIFDADGSPAQLGLTTFSNTPNTVFQFASARGTAASFSALQAGDGIGVFGAVGAAGANQWAGSGTSTARIGFLATENFINATNLGTKIFFDTTPTGSNIRANAMTIQASGGLSVGTATDPGIGSVISNIGLQTVATTVGGLPTCVAALKGMRRFVTDANANTFHTTAAAGGGNNVGVTCDGTNWYIS